MADMRELQAIIRCRETLDEELTASIPQLRPLEHEIQTLKVEAHNKQLDAEQLSRPGLRSAVLRWTGRHEAAVTRAVREARAARDALQTALFRQETLQNRVHAIQNELAATADTEAACLRLLEAQHPNAPAIREAAGLLRQLQQAAQLRSTLPEQLSKTKARLSRVLRTYETGDIQTDLTGHRFDNKFRTMKELCIPAQEDLSLLLPLLTQYTDLYDQNLQTAAPGPWTAEPKYLTAPSFDAKDLQERVDDVFCWVQQLERCLRDLQTHNDLTERAWRQSLRRLLLEPSF